MTTRELKGKLAAIFSAGEKETVRTLNTYEEVMTRLIQHRHGRVVDAPGDNVLAEFSSVADTVECAIEIQ
jgi:adenylate cyclase